MKGLEGLARKVLAIWCTAAAGSFLELAKAARAKPQRRTPPRKPAWYDEAKVVRE